MFSFEVVGTALQKSSESIKPRVGKLWINNHGLDTPNYILPTSRGAVPHLSHDNLRDHTNIKGVYTALEDFVERPPPKNPLFNHAGDLRSFTAHPNTSLQILGARRCPPVATSANNTDYSVAILTSVGFGDLKVHDFISNIRHMNPDIAISIADIPTQRPGKNRIPKMLFRTEKWLSALLTEAGGDVPVFASLLPVAWEQQQYYGGYLKDKRAKISGIALYDSALAPNLPEELTDLPLLSLDDPRNPHEVLKRIAWGIDVFDLQFLVAATDAGIALDFEFPGTVKEGEKKPMGMDMWDTEFATDLDPLVQGCGCYTCRKHHRAYIRHLLSAKEMTAWVLLQIHNARLVDKFFEKVRESIAQGRFEEDTRKFGEVYEPELPKKTGEGPRMRGYQFKTEPGPKKNRKAFEKFVADNKEETLEEAMPPPDVDAEQMEKGGFAERLPG